MRRIFQVINRQSVTHSLPKGLTGIAHSHDKQPDYYIATLNGTDLAETRNLAKSVAEE